MGCQTTGTLGASSNTILDFTAFPMEIFNSNINVNFSSGIKSITITNNWGGPTQGFASGNSDMASLTIAATGLNGFSGLFNGESGNIKLLPYGSWTFTDWVGVLPNATNKEISIIDNDGSGVTYEVTVVGVSGA